MIPLMGVPAEVLVCRQKYLDEQSGWSLRQESIHRSCPLVSSYAFKKYKNIINNFDFCCHLKLRFKMMFLYLLKKLMCLKFLQKLITLSNIHTKYIFLIWRENAKCFYFLCQVDKIFLDSFILKRCSTLRRKKTITKMYSKTELWTRSNIQIGTLQTF